MDENMKNEAVEALDKVMAEENALAAEKETPAKASEPAPKPPQNTANKTNFTENYWKPWLWPLAALVSICLVTSLLLALVNNLTSPIIAENDLKAANETRRALLPAADNFSELEPADKLPDNILSAYKADNGAGYVIEAYAVGYNGNVPVAVAFDANGAIVGVRFMENSETPGLGQKLYTNKSFAEQFVGHAATPVTLGDIDKIASATISTNAGLAAVNNAIDYFSTRVLGESNASLTPAQIRTMLFDGASMAAPVELNDENITEAWFGDNGHYVIYATAPGFYDNKLLTAAVGISGQGEITAIWLDTSNDTDGLGSEVGNNQAFKDSFIGKTGTDGIDAVASATVTSNGVFRAVETALAALPAAQNAPLGDYVMLPSLPLTKEDRQAMDEDAILAWLLPGQTLKPVDTAATTAYKGGNGCYILYGRAPGFHDTKDIIAMVAVDQNGNIINLWLNTSGDTDGLGSEVEHSSDFTASFYGLGAGDVSLVDGVAGATVTSDGAKQAILDALSYFDTVKGAG